jgi:hypothetical protein
MRKTLKSDLEMIELLAETTNKSRIEELESFPATQELAEDSKDHA